MIHIEGSTLEIKRIRTLIFKGTEKEFEELVTILLHAETLARAWGTATKESRLSLHEEDVLGQFTHSFKRACCW